LSTLQSLNTTPRSGSSRDRTMIIGVCHGFRWCDVSWLDIRCSLISGVFNLCPGILRRRSATVSPNIRIIRPLIVPLSSLWYPLLFRTKETCLYAILRMEHAPCRSPVHTGTIPAVSWMNPVHSRRPAANHSTCSLPSATSHAFLNSATNPRYRASAWTTSQRYSTGVSSIPCSIHDFAGHCPAELRLPSRIPKGQNPRGQGVEGLRGFRFGTPWGARPIKGLADKNPTHFPEAVILQAARISPSIQTGSYI